jgi:hypothetical protein
MITKDKFETVWETWSYDVWGNAREGYDVNNRFCMDRDYPLTLKIEVNNPGTDLEFLSAYPSDKQIKEALGIGSRVRMEIDGDDRARYVVRERDGLPLGEMHLESPVSLSPIREEV